MKTELKRAERKKAEDALKESEEKFRNIFESANDCMIFLDRSGRILNVNRKTAEVFGGQKKELLGKHFLKHFLKLGVISPKDAPTLAAEFAKALTGKRATLEICIENKKGQKVFLESSAYPIKKDDEVIGLMTIARDVTERKRAEEALRESENKYRVLLENLPQKIFFKDRNSVYKICNENYARDRKIRPEEIAGKTDYDFFPKELAEKYRADDKRIMESGNTEELEGSRYVQDGEERLVHTVKVPVKDEQNNVIGILGIFWDITERKQAEEMLRIRNRAIESSINAIALADLEGNLTYVNPSFLKLWGYDDEKEVLGRYAEEFWQEPEKASEVIEALRDRGSWIGEMVAMRKDGSIFDVQISTSMITDDAGKPICMMGSFVDITERKRAEEEKLKAQKQRIEELEKLTEIAVGRELEMIELKGRVRALELKLKEITGKG